MKRFAGAEPSAVSGVYGSARLRRSALACSRAGRKGQRGWRSRQHRLRTDHATGTDLDRAAWTEVPGTPPAVPDNGTHSTSIVTGDATAAWLVGRGPTFYREPAPSAP